MPDDKLTPKQWAFVREYLVDCNATRAAIRAGYSRKTAGQKGHSMLKKVEIREAVERGQAEAAERAQITASQITSELADIARDPEAPPAARVSAYREINDMLGFRVPTKIEGVLRRETTVIVEMPPERVREFEEREAARLARQAQELDEPKEKQDNPGE
jgi:hypothetical protein